MALFDRKQNANKPDAGNVSESVSAKQESVSKMDGYATMGDVKNAAPDSTSSFTVEPERQRGKRSTTRNVKDVAQEAGAIQSEKDRLKALETAGKRILERLASVPYDAWAKLAEDEFYRLKPDEAKELAESYYLIAQGAKMDFSKPIWMITGVACLHLILVSERLKYMNEKAESAKDENLAKVAVN